MTNFEKVAASPEALGEFLAALPVATGPWDGAFRKQFCDSCERKNCDEKRCPHQDKRNNPLWWLTQRLRRMGLADADGRVDRDVMTVFACIFAGQFYDDLCDY